MAQISNPVFAKWIRQAAKDLPRFERELEKMQQAHEDGLDEFVALRERLFELQGEIDQHSQIIGFLKGLTESVNSAGAEGTESDTAALTGGGSPDQPKTKPQVVTRVLEIADRGLFPREARELAVQRAWLPNTPAAANQLSVSMNKMARQGRLLKDDDGRYYLPQWTVTVGGSGDKGAATTAA